MTTIEQARAEVLLHTWKYHPDFYKWICENFAIYLQFERESDKLRASGRDHYSHRTIWEYLRHETNLREVGSEFKMNDHFTKSCAILYLRMRPEAKQFFSFRFVHVEQIARAA
jgi:hypothetical protein